MATKLRTSLSESNPYYISKERRCELTHYCLQYSEWRDAYNACLGIRRSFDPVPDIVILRELYSQRMKTVEAAASLCEPFITEYILAAVTEKRSYENLRMEKDIPCCKRTFYENLHKFFWSLDKLLTEREVRYL